MERRITGFSVDENLISGKEFYGDLGNLMGVIDTGDNKYISVIKKDNNQYCYRDTVIDASVSMSKNGPVVHESVYLGSSEKSFDTRLLDKIEEYYSKFQNLDTFLNGEINIDNALESNQGSVFVAEDNVLQYFQKCKQQNPELPLVYASKIMLYQNDNAKSL